MEEEPQTRNRDEGGKGRQGSEEEKEDKEGKEGEKQERKTEKSKQGGTQRVRTLKGRNFLRREGADACETHEVQM